MDLLFIGTGFLLIMTLGLALYAAPVLLMTRLSLSRDRARTPSPGQPAAGTARIGLGPLKALFGCAGTCALATALFAATLLPHPYLMVVVFGLGLYLYVKRLLRGLGLRRGQGRSPTRPKPPDETPDVGPFLLKALLALGLGSAIFLMTGILGGVFHASHAFFEYCAPGFAISKWAYDRWSQYVSIDAVWGGVGLGLSGVIYSVPVFIAETIILARRERRLRR